VCECGRCRPTKENECGECFETGAVVTSDHRRYGDAKSLGPRVPIWVHEQAESPVAVQAAAEFAIELLGSS